MGIVCIFIRMTVFGGLAVFKRSKMLKEIENVNIGTWIMLSRF